jgi:hypothetical protein
LSPSGRLNCERDGEDVAIGEPELAPQLVHAGGVDVDVHVRLGTEGDAGQDVGVADLPRTATGKIVVRALVRDRWDGDVWIRDGAVVRPMTAEDRAALEKAFADSGRPLL